MARQNLLDQTYRLLDESALKWHEIASGAGVDRNWLIKFGRREIGEPGVTKVQAVYDFLSSTKKSVRVRDHVA